MGGWDFWAFWLAAGVSSQAAPVSVPPVPGTSASDQATATVPSGKAQTDPGPATVADVEVVASRQDQADRIDRRVYTFARDPIAQSSTALEVIGRIPSVSVSSSGLITLLGQGAASVLIDGKPIVSNDALRALLGADLDRVEVMTNPSSEFRAQGTGGVVNIVTKRRRPLGLSGTWLASADTQENLRLSLTTALTVDKLTLSGNLALEQTGEAQDRVRYREALVTSVNSVSETSGYEQYGDTLTGLGSATFNIDDNRSVTLGGSFTSAKSQTWTNVARTLSGPSSASYDEQNQGAGDVDIMELNGELRLVSADRRATTRYVASLSSSDVGSSDRFVRSYDGATPDIFTTDDRYRTNKASLGASLEYDPSEKIIVKAGMNLDAGDQDNSHQSGINQSPPSSSSLSGGTRVLSAYGSVQWPMLGWTIMSGLRAETATYSIKTDLFERDPETDLFPSLFLRRSMSAWTLNLSYSKRINRPDLTRLDPRIIFSSTTDASVGNPELSAELTDAWEVRLENASNDNSTTATFYHRATTDVWQPFFTMTPDDVVLQTFVNAGDRINSGVELSVRRKISERLRLIATANLFRSQQNILTDGPASTGTNTELTASLIAAYKPRGSDPKSDTIQLSLRYSSASRGYQSTTSDSISSSLSWRRPLTPRLSSVFTVSDIFDTGHQKFALSTSEFRQVVEVQGLGPQAKWTLAYRFGALQ